MTECLLAQSGRNYMVNGPANECKKTFPDKTISRMQNSGERPCHGFQTSIHIAAHFNAQAQTHGCIKGNERGSSRADKRERDPGGR